MAEDTDLYNRRLGTRERDLLRQVRDVVQEDGLVIDAQTRCIDGGLERELPVVEGIVRAINDLARYRISSEERDKYRDIISRYFSHCHPGQKLSAQQISDCIMDIRLANPRVYLKCLDGSGGYTPDQAETVFDALKERFAPDIGVKSNPILDNNPANIPTEDDLFK